MDPVTRRQVARLIAGLVVSDSDLDPTEEAFVDKMLARFEIDDSEREVIFPIVDGGEAAEALAKMAPEVQTEAFEMLLEAAAADGQIVEEEQSYLEAVATVVNVSKDELATRLAAALAARKA